MAKMYYTEAETAARLGVQVADLAGLARDGKLKAFQDGARRMFKSADVDALAPAASDEIELAPAGGDRVDLSKGESAKPPSKQDTVITSAGISIFDDDELEIEAADPMAKTQITPTLEEQMSTEGVGSGSGLLDLTRESDDTSLGAEVLENIDVEGGVGSDLAAAAEAPAEDARPAAFAPAMPEAAAAEALDASSGLFGGLLISCAVLAIFFGTVVAGVAQGFMPDYVKGMKANVPIVLVAVVLVLLAGAIFGLMSGKSAAARQAAMRRIGA